MTENRATRAVRAAVFTALAVPLAALGQVVITGRALPLTLVAAAAGAVFLLAVVLSGARRCFLPVAAALVPVELLLNTAFNLGQDSCAAPPSHGMDLLVCGGGSLGGSPLADWAGGATGTVRLVVLLAHLALALVAAAWLSHGDAAIGRGTEALHALRVLLAAPLRALRLLVPLPLCPAATAPSPAADRPPRPTEYLAQTPAPRRGPPTPALAG